jgi:hypothetical protein
MGDEVRGLWVACLGQVNLVADPERVALLRIACLDIVGRIDDLTGGRQFVVRSPTPALGAQMIVLLPDLAQGPHRRHLLQPGGRML